ncbi:MAG: divergent polysaccharide deacetylase family protein [Candidatus Omnitrophota bacterium]
MLRNYKIAVVILSTLLIIQGVFIFVLLKPKKAVKAPPTIIKTKPQIAIVLDDWGYNLNGLPVLDQIKYPLTMSVLPNLAYSKTISLELHNRGFEIILHLPTEPLEKIRLEENTILTTMDEMTIKNILNLDLENTPYVKGVSNHMGSKLTSDIKSLRFVFKELKKRNLFFLDSLVSSRSIASTLAANEHISFAKRDVFLDNKADYNYIKQQLQELKNIAKARGKAIGIGHDHKLTLEVLRDVMPEIEREGFKFVFVSELVK